MAVSFRFVLQIYNEFKLIYKILFRHDMSNPIGCKML